MNKLLQFFYNAAIWVDDHKAYGIFILIMVTLSLICSGYTVDHEYHHEQQYRIGKKLWSDTRDSVYCGLNDIRSRLDRIESSNEVQLEWIKAIYYKEIK